MSMCFLMKVSMSWANGTNILLPLKPRLRVQSAGDFEVAQLLEKDLVLLFLPSVLVLCLLFKTLFFFKFCPYNISIYVFFIINSLYFVYFY